MAHGFHLPWQVRGLLLDEEVDHAKRDYYLKGVHIVVGTPQLMAAAMAGPDPQPVVQHTKVVAGGRCCHCCHCCRCCCSGPWWRVGADVAAGQQQGRAGMGGGLAAGRGAGAQAGTQRGRKDQGRSFIVCPIVFHAC